MMDPRRWMWPGLIVLLLASAAVFVVRGPVRGMEAGSDFAIIYAPVRAWLHGENPYDLPAVERVWLAAGGGEEEGPFTREQPDLLYPPSALTPLAPFAAAPWPAARTIFLVVNVGLLLIVIWCVARVAGFAWRDPLFWLFTALVLMFMPVHTMHHHGQTTLLAMAPLSVALAALSTRGDRRRRWWTGALMGFASAVKPQIGLPFLAFEVLRRRWSSVTAAGAMIVVAALIGIVPMQARGHDWLAGWTGNIAAFADDGQGDSSRANPLRFQHLNLHYPLHEFIEHPRLVQVIVLALLGAIAAAYFLTPRSFRRDDAGEPRDVLAAWSFIAVLTLLVTYHRYYDAILLLYPLAWAMASVRARVNGRWPLAVLALMLPFFLNSTAVLFALSWGGRLPAWLAESRFFEAVIMPHQPYALLLMALCLLAARYAPPAAASSPRRATEGHGGGQ